MTSCTALTISYRPNGGLPEPLAQITLKGNWLSEAGFITGRPLDVRVLPDCLVVTLREPKPEPPDEPDVVTQLRQIAVFIQMIASKPALPRPRPGQVVWRELKPR